MFGLNNVKVLFGTTIKFATTIKYEKKKIKTKKTRRHTES